MTLEVKEALKKSHGGPKLSTAVPNKIGAIEIRLNVREREERGDPGLVMLPRLRTSDWLFYLSHFQSKCSMMKSRRSSLSGKCVKDGELKRLFSGIRFALNLIQADYTIEGKVEWLGAIVSKMARLE